MEEQIWSQLDIGWSKRLYRWDESKKMFEGRTVVSLRVDADQGGEPRV